MRKALAWKKYVIVLSILMMIAILPICAFNFAAPSEEPKGRMILIEKYCLPDLILCNGKIITMDKSGTIAEAVAIKGDKILAVGTTKDIRKLAGPDTEIMDLEGKTVIPGLQDSHIHFTGLGTDRLFRVNLEPARSIQDILDILAAWIAEKNPAPGEWIQGIRWDWVKLAEQRMANRFELDTVTPNNPVFLDYVEDGLALNSYAMNLNGMTETWEYWTTDPPWTDELNYIERFQTGPHAGEPTGVIYGERSGDLMTQRPPRFTLEQTIQGLYEGQRRMLSLGVTAIVQPGITDIRPYQIVYNTGDLKLRVVAYLAGSSNKAGWLETRFRQLYFNNLGDDHLRWRGLKLFQDGGIGSMTGAVSVPYVFGKPNNYGEIDYTYEEFVAAVRKAAEWGWEVHTHNTGDRANDQTVDAYIEVLEEHPGEDLRYSVIHNFLANEPETSVVERMAEYGIISVTNTIFLYELGGAFGKFIGPERLARFCPNKSLMDGGVVVCGASDYSVCTEDPWKGMYAMITRKVELTGEVVGPAERVTILQALKAYTNNGVYLTYDENKRGSIEVGKYADLVVLNKDPLTVSPEEILTMGNEVSMTIIDGKIAWEA